MKLIFRSLLVFLVIWMGFTFYTSSMDQRLTKLYVDEAVPALVNGRVQEYMEKSMVISGNEKFLIEPIYQFESKDNIYNFNLDVYHSQTKDEMAIHFILYNFLPENYIDLIKNKEAYNKDKNVVMMEMTINTNISNYILKYGFNMNEGNLPSNGSLTSALVIAKNGDDFNFVDRQDGIKSFNEITSLEFNFLDGSAKTNKDSTIHKTLIAKIETSSDALENNNDILFTEDTYNGATYVKASGLKSKVENYANLKDVYSDTSKVHVTDFKLLKKYNNIVVKTMVIYSVVALIVIFLIFFLKPIQERLANKKQLKTESSIKN